MARERSREPEAVRITSAAASRNDDIRTRQRRYLISMVLRTVCFIGMILASLAGIHWLWPIFLVGAIVLPYVAVVMANASAPRSDGFELLEGGPARPQLDPGSGH